MKKMFAALCALLLVPTMASANSDLVSIAELHRQTVERGRWTKTYDTPNGELNVDIPILGCGEMSCHHGGKRSAVYAGNC